MLKVDQAFIERLRGGLPTREEFAALHADIQPPRPWHQNKLEMFLTNLKKQTKDE